MVRPHNLGTSQSRAHPLFALFWLDEPARTSAGDAVTSIRLAGLDLRACSRHRP